MGRSLKCLVLVIGSCLYAVAAALAQSCPEVLNSVTGDPGWLLVSGPVKGPPVDIKPLPGWYVPKSGAWISPEKNPGNTPKGKYTWEYRFCVCGKGPTGAAPVLELQYAGYSAAEALLNAKLIGSCSTVKTLCKAKASVVNGNNVLEIVVNDTKLTTALYANLQVTGASSGPCRTAGN